MISARLNVKTKHDVLHRLEDFFLVKHHQDPILLS